MLYAHLYTSTWITGNLTLVHVSIAPVVATPAKPNSHILYVFVDDENVSSEMRSLFGPVNPTYSSQATTRESFATRAERLCERMLSGTLTQEGNGRRRKRTASTPAPRIKEWTKNIIMIDFQGQKGYEALPLYDYQKIFDGLISISSNDSEHDVRCSFG